MMKHKPDIALVDAQPKGYIQAHSSARLLHKFPVLIRTNGCTHDVDMTFAPLLVESLLQRVVDFAVVHTRLDLPMAVLRKIFCYGLCVLFTPVSG